MIHRLTVLHTTVLSLWLIASSAAAEEIRFFTWSDYTDPEALAGFSEASGQPLIVDTYAESDVAEARLFAGGDDIDLAVAPLSALGRLLDAGALRPFDPARSPEPEAMDPQIVARMLDFHPEALRYAAPYLWGHTGMVIDEETVLRLAPDAPLDSWALIFDPENASRLAECGIGVVDSSDEVIAAALAYLGRDPTSDDDDDLDAAFAAISAIAPYLRGANSSHYDTLIRKELCVALTWSSEGIGAEWDLEASPYRYVTPKEGGNIWFDVLVLPANGREEAYVLLDYLLRPEIMAANADWGYGATALIEATAQRDEEVAAHPAIAADPSRLYALPQRSGARSAELDARWRRALLGL